MIKRLPKSVACAITGVGALGVTVVLLSLARCPIELKLQSLEHAVIIDDQGQELWFMTLSIRNKRGLPLVCDGNKTRLQIKIRNEWVEVAEPFRFGWLSASAAKQCLVVVPHGVDACRLRLRFSYQHTRLGWILWGWADRVFPRAANAFATWMWRVNRAQWSRFFNAGQFRPSNWREITKEVSFPPQAG
jgi:hypothetical protein